MGRRRRILNQPDGRLDAAEPFGRGSLRIEVDDEARRPRSPKAAARLTVVVVLPLPPLLLDSAIIRI